MKKRKDFTADDIAMIERMIGMHPARLIAERIGTTESCIVKHCLQHGISISGERHAVGLPIYHLSKLWGVNHNQIRHWVIYHGLPTIAPQDKDKHFTIIDESKLGKWLESGYALASPIQPVTPEHIALVENARQKLYKQMIPTQWISRIIFINNETVYRWMRKGKMIKPDFVYKSQRYHNRISLSLYLKEIYGVKVANRVFDVEWSINEQ